MSWAWFHRLGSPKWFYGRFKAWPKPLFCLACLCLMVAMVWGLAIAPPDYQQGNSFRIIYMHVPAAILAQSCYFFMGVAGLVYLVWQIKMSPIFLKAVAPFGALMAFIALLTGSIWGKPTWGTWWVWDARLTSVLVLLFLYMGIIAVQSALEERSLADKAAAVVSVVGLLNLPVIKYSVEWWNTLHQGTTFSITEPPSMPMAMWLPLLFAVIGMYLLAAAVIMWRMQTEIMRREAKTHWLKQEVLSDGV